MGRVKDYNVDGLVGCAKRVKLASGLTVGLYHCEQQGLSRQDGGPWATICEDHGGLVQHPTKAVAASWLRHPSDWCPTCQEARDRG